MNIIDAIYKRRSVRKFFDKKVSRQDLTELVKLGCAGPTAMNKKPWKFIVIEEKETMDELRGVMRFGRYNAPAAIIVCGDMKKAISLIGKDFWIQDCSAAMENMMLGAIEMGLGTLWLGATPLKYTIEHVSALLGLPKHMIPLGVMYVGYPVDETEPRTQFSKDNIVFGKMGESRKPRIFPKEPKPAMSAMQAILSRRSIRKYTGKVVDNDTIKELIEAGQCAPTAMNTRPWEFVVIRDAEKLLAIQKVHPYSKMLSQAGCGILVCGNRDLSSDIGYLSQDCSAAIQNILLAAHASDKGLGAVWLGIYPNDDRVKDLIEISKLPENITPIGLIAVGYADESKKATQRFDESKIHYDEF